MGRAWHVQNCSMFLNLFVVFMFFSNICFHNLSHLSLSDEVDIATPRMQCLELQTSTAVVRRYIGISSTLGVAEVLGPCIA